MSTCVSPTFYNNEYWQKHDAYWKAQYANSAQCLYPKGRKLREPFLLGSPTLSQQFFKTKAGELFQTMTKTLIDIGWLREKSPNDFFRYCNRWIQQGTCYGQTKTYGLSRGWGRKKPLFSAREERCLSIYYQVQHQLSRVIISKKMAKTGMLRILETKIKSALIKNTPLWKSQIERINKEFLIVETLKKQAEKFDKELWKYSCAEQKKRFSIIQKMNEKSLSFSQRTGSVLKNVFSSEKRHDFELSYCKSGRGHILYVQTMDEIKLFDSNCGLVKYQTVDSMIDDLLQVISASGSNTIMIDYSGEQVS